MNNVNQMGGSRKPWPWLAVGGITVVFVAAYFVMRALPAAECGFLHYEEIVLEDGTVEFCATNHAGFIDLTRLEYPVQAEFSFSEAPRVGQPVEVNLELTTSGGTAIASHQLALTHTKKMHLMVIDPSLEDYQHIHPEPVSINGEYTFSFTPKHGGDYHFYTEVVPVITRRQLIADNSHVVDGPEQSALFRSQTRESEVDGVRFRLEGLPERLKTGVDYRFGLNVAAIDGKALKLEDIMGAKGHMVAFDAARRGFAHMHPEDSIASVKTAGLGSVGSANELGFIFNVPNPGWYRVFAQVQIEGREVFGRFDVKVE